MKLRIEHDVFQLFPGLKVGVVVGRGLRIRRRSQELRNLIDENSRKLLEKIGNQKLADLPNINSWRETYRQLGVSPKKHRPTAEALLRRVIKGQGVPNINTAVDAYLAVELLTMLPIGGYDLGAIAGDICLKVSKGGECFFPLGGEDVQYTNPGEIVYADNKSILTRHWNYRDCENTKITENSQDIILASEAALEDINPRDLTDTLDKIVEYESAFCQGNYKIFLLDKDTPDVDLE
jgi:DNA/RNA-binding domain of Phe-tRNA-synthetase-like protein